MDSNNKSTFPFGASCLSSSQLLELSTVHFGVKVHFTFLSEKKEKESRTELVTDDFQDMKLSFWDKVKIIYYNSKGFNQSPRNAEKLGKYYERSLQDIAINYYRYTISPFDNYMYKDHADCYKRNFEFAYCWYHQSADGGDYEGMYRLGNFLKKYYSSPPFLECEEPDIESMSTMYRLYYAYHYLEQAAKKGHLQAMYSLAQLYQENTIYTTPEESSKQALYWLASAAKHGHIKAKIDQAAADAMRGDHEAEEYINLCREYEEKGSTYAQCHLADCYYDGKYLSADRQKAKEILMRAAEKYDPLAAYRLANINFTEGNQDKGLCYSLFSFYYGYTPGMFVAVAYVLENKNLFEDQTFYDKVFLGANFTAVCNELALHHLKGLYGCNPSDERALFWYKRSAFHNDSYAQMQIQQLEPKYPPLHSLSSIDEDTE